MTQRVVILGAGESGTGAAILAKAKGYDTFVSDKAGISPAYKRELEKRGIAWEELQHTDSLIMDADLVIKSPGIPDHVPIVQKIKAANIPVISEIEFAGRHTDAKMICITGSNGKTTTTMLTYHILQTAGLDVGLAGNVGQSLAWQVAETKHAYYVVELSSFQLDGMYDFRANIAILLNITPDHLDRYNYEMQNYVDSKLRILQNQTPEDTFIYWEEDPIISKEVFKRLPLPANIISFSLLENEKSLAYFSEESIIFFPKNKRVILGKDTLKISGNHNYLNTMSSVLAAITLGVEEENIRIALKSFTNVEHRMEHVLKINGVSYINDSKATNVTSCFYALQSIETPIVLILGGTDKGNDYTEIQQLVDEKVHTLIFLGIDNDKLHKAFDGGSAATLDARSMQEAVSLASQKSRKGDTVLLSPCCASFDLFANYEDRGVQFKNRIMELSKNV